ncbi:SAM-dependent DNA methyltransferase [Roseobacter denitrificans]|uniref:site-specific DNA-methyltransferase (adenine-specific) n=1 Tax=Roseobacter denitrificans (strain ATCC 33942 / OCh 114) TaxID=375451 RepID=Q160U6_ROSDO|nr:class I SAM-dependent DNA methyltransferase [Roseobacter denitrificans]ABG33497.1 type I restriction-modification system DNA methylase, putative [Roseobacter denitrificans OCh 114]AVL52813.1 SAM-dependent DNA methyltransferase [Roseobacter denitrificans]SFG05134.1 type I restriction enzyme M protein [Roseobacter denitrificans OCh 114]
MSDAQTKNTSLADFIWKNADDLWGDFRHTEFGKIILPFTLLRRLECVLAPTREEVRETVKNLGDSGIDMDVILRQQTGFPFYNTSNYDLRSLGATRTRANLEDYISQFSDNARVIFEQFDFANTIARMDRAGVLYKICQNFAAIDLHPDTVPERTMSNVYEHLIRRFGAEVNEAAEDFMTPRDVVHLAIELLLDPDDQLFIENPGLIRTLYDPTCGTGGFLSDGMEHVRNLQDRYSIAPVIIPYGQELEPETHAVCLAGMLLKTLETDPGRDLSKNIALGSTLSADKHRPEKFHYCVSNPPFGKKWEKDQADVTREHKEQGFEGRFGPKLPRVSDGSMLFLLHLLSKLESPENGGGRAAIILSGSPLFNGNAGQGESEIRRHLLEQDVVEAIIALPTEIFFRTGIGTYIWILSNDKPAHRKGKVQLINATEMYEPMRKSEGNKRRRVGEQQTRDIVQMYADFEATKQSLILSAPDFGYRRIKVLRPLRKKIVISAEGLATLADEKAWEKRTEAQRAGWTALFNDHMGAEEGWHWIEAFAKNAVKRDADLGKADVALIKAFRKALGVHDPELDPVTDKKGQIIPDDDLTDFENVPLAADGTADIHGYLAAEVTPHAHDAYIDETYRDESDGQIGIKGYEINFNRYFYEYLPPRDLDEIDAELKAVEAEIAAVLAEVAG